MQFERAEQVFNHWASRLLGDPRVSSELGHSFAFEIVDEASSSLGQRWVFSPGPPPKVSEGEGRADCTILVSAKTLLAIANCELNPQVAYLSGAIKLSGQIENALKLAVLLGGAK
jgi:putative sterol carrier protein